MKIHTWRRCDYRFVVFPLPSLLQRIFRFGVENSHFHKMEWHCVETSKNGTPLYAICDFRAFYAPKSYTHIVHHCAAARCHAVASIQPPMACHVRWNKSEQEKSMCVAFFFGCNLQLTLWLLPLQKSLWKDKTADSQNCKIAHTRTLSLARALTNTHEGQKVNDHASIHEMVFTLHILMFHVFSQRIWLRRIILDPDATCSAGAAVAMRAWLNKMKPSVRRFVCISLCDNALGATECTRRTNDRKKQHEMNWNTGASRTSARSERKMERRNCVTRNRDENVVARPTNGILFGL